MKIQMLTLVGAAFGFTLQEIPDLPDLVGIVENAIHGHFNEQTVEEPRAFLPTIAEIKAMTDRERAERFHWFLCVFVAVFLFVTIVKTVIMIVGAELKALSSCSGSDHPAGQRSSTMAGHVELWSHSVPELRCNSMEPRNWKALQDSWPWIGKSICFCFVVPVPPFLSKLCWRWSGSLRVTASMLQHLPWLHFHRWRHLSPTSTTP